MSDQPLQIKEAPPEEKEEGYISLDSAGRFAKSMGMMVSSAAILKNTASLGDYMEQLGVVKIGRGKLAFTLEKMDKTSARIERMLRGEKDAKTKASLIRAQIVLTKAMVDASNKLIVSAEQTKKEPLRIEVQRGNPSFPPAVQFNIINHAIKPTTTTIEESPPVQAIPETSPAD